MKGRTSTQHSPRWLDREVTECRRRQELEPAADSITSHCCLTHTALSVLSHTQTVSTRTDSMQTRTWQLSSRQLSLLCLPPSYRIIHGWTMP